MGISDLIRKLGPITESKHISDFSNKTAVVDIMTWLYKGLYACASSQPESSKSDLYLNYPIKMIALLKSYNIDVLVVFDGKTIKEKQKIDVARKETREQNIEKAQYFKNAGDEDESRKFFKRALKIKSRMINTLINLLKDLKIQVIVAPYEADSQLAYLVRKKYADFVISEDSDLIALGVDDIVMKLTPEGSCVNINLKKFKENRMEKYSDKIVKEIKGLSYVNFLELCVMSGCDYLPSIKGFGFKTGLALFEKHKKMESVFHEMKFIEKFKTKIPDNYLENAKKTVCMFFYQTVFDPKLKKLLSLNSFRYEDGDDLDKTYSRDYINKFVSEILDKNQNNSKIKSKSKKIFEDLTEKINNEVNAEIENKINFTQEDLFKLFGEEFPNYVMYCNGDLDVKKLTVEKKIEEEKSFIYYKNKYEMLVNFNKKNNKLNSEKTNNIEDKKFEDIKEEEIYRIISENENDLEDNYLDQQDKKNFPNNSENIFLNKKRKGSNCDEKFTEILNVYNINKEDILKNNIAPNNFIEIKVVITPTILSPEKNNTNEVTRHMFKSEGKTAAKNLLELINNEKSSDLNTKTNFKYTNEEKIINNLNSSSPIK